MITECQRLVENGIIEASFLEPEYRCDFLIDQNRKKIWAIELDLYMQIERVCRKYNLTYFLIFGSLLGCIRHSGFIPWDDDLDIAMPRKDYDIFTSLADEFENPYFLQTPQTEKNSGFSVAKLRNSNTSAIAEPFKHQRMNHGIFVDIVPIDKVDMREAESNYHMVKYLALQNSAYMRMNNPNPNIKDKKRIANWKGQNPLDVYKEIHKICSKHEKEEQQYAGITSATIYDYTKQIFKIEDFDDIIWHRFENTVVPIPGGYDDILKTLYNDYMKFPSKNKRGMAHESLYFDPDISYKKYLLEEIL